MSKKNKNRMLNLITKNKRLFGNILTSPVTIILFPIVILLGINRKSAEFVRNIYYAYRIRVIQKQIKKYEIHSNNNLPGNNTVWVYWDVGLDNAPDIVKICAERLQNIDEEKIIFLNSENINEYITMPAEYQTALDLGYIPKAHYSDLLRTELLYKHGGIWLDATVYLSNNTIPDELKSDEFFVYCMSLPALNCNPIYLSSWAIASPPRSPILGLTREYLKNYWKKKSKLNDYFLFHMVLCAILNEFPNLRPSTLGFYDNSKPHLLQLRFSDRYDEKIFQKIMEQTSIHKLTYKYENVIDGSMLSHILKL